NTERLSFEAKPWLPEQDWSPSFEPDCQSNQSHHRCNDQEKKTSYNLVLKPFCAPSPISQRLIKHSQQCKPADLFNTLYGKINRRHETNISANLLETIQSPTQLLTAVATRNCQHNVINGILLRILSQIG